jgi:hypothetical protein
LTSTLEGALKTNTTARATLSRRGEVVATGSSTRAHGTVLHTSHTDLRGRYRLTLHYGSGGRSAHIIVTIG